MADRGQPELRSYDPSWRERLAGWLMGDTPAMSPRGQYVEALTGSRGLGSSGPGLLDFTPAGAAFAGNEAVRDYNGGNYVGAAINGLAAVPGVAWAAAARPVRQVASNVAERFRPAASNTMEGLGNSAANGAENLASMRNRIYDPRPRPQRPFEADYPGTRHGEHFDGEGRLTHTIEGVPITARFVAGRREVGGADQGLARGEFDAIAEGLTGSLPTPLSPREMGRNNGIISVDRRSGRPYDIFYDRSLSPDDQRRVIGHEAAGHAVEIAGVRGMRDSRGRPIEGFPTEGLQADLIRNYHNLATDEYRWGPRVTPKSQGYATREKQQRELVAEALRGYATDPNSFKAQFPELAAWIRANVNDNPNLNRIIQFNSLAGLGGAGLLEASSDPSQASENPSHAVAREEMARAAERAGLSPIDAMLFALRQTGQP